MSAPFMPAPRTRTRSSFRPGSGSGRSSTTSRPSWMVAARTGATYPARETLMSHLMSRVQRPRVKGPPLMLRSARPPLWREARLGLEAAALLRDPVLRGEGLADGRGQPALLIPGFLAGDGSLALMADWLRRAGYRPSRAGMVANVACGG